MTDSDKCSHLVQFRIIYDRKNVFSTGRIDQSCKAFVVVIYTNIGVNFLYI